MAFGLTVTKWGILKCALTTKVKKIKHILLAIACLHNFCINERLLKTGSLIMTPKNADLGLYEKSQRDSAANIQFEHLQQDYNNTQSHNRVRMVEQIKALQLVRPSNNR